MNQAATTTYADAVVVGAGPGGSAAARFLADAGHEVILLEKSSFPRDKVCGDALTPRAVRALEQLGLDDEAAGKPAGWARQSGLRMYGGKTVIDLPWPDVGGWPTHSLTATRSLFDQTLARHAVKGGVQLWQRTEATAPVWLSEREERIAGVAYRTRDREEGEVEEGVVRSPLVVIADGNASRLSVAMGLHRDRSRPMGVAVRAYYSSPQAQIDRMEGFLEMRTPPATGERYEDGALLPAYGWIFPLDDGLVNVGWGLLDSSEHFQSVSYRKVLDAWVDTFPPEWEITAETRTGSMGSAGLPMAHNRHPMLHRGALLVGDSSGMVNPFNGEGISYAIEAAAMAAEAGDAALATGSDAPLARYPQRVQEAWGGYYTLGRAFTSLMGHPTVMRVCRDYGMPRRRLMDFVFRTMAHLVSPRSRDATDVVLNSLSRMVPVS